MQESVAEEFARRLTERVEAMTVGRGTEDGVAIGPLIDQRAVDKAHRLVTDALDRGATLRTGGQPVDGPGTFYAPTVITDVQPGSDLLRDEIFGPVLAIRTFSSRTRASPRRTTPSTASSGTRSPRTPPADSGSWSGSRPACSG